MNEFKVDDLVKCINAGLHLTEGNVYKVLYVNDNCNTGAFDTLIVKNDYGVDAEYFSSRFELYTIPTDPLVTIKQSEYDDLIEEINLLRELLAETTNVEEYEDLSSVFFFKPISEYTLEDWQQAIDEDWEFECRGGCTIQIIEVAEHANYPVRGTDSLLRDVNGFRWSGDKDSDDIVKRIR